MIQLESIVELMNSMSVLFYVLIALLLIYYNETYRFIHFIVSNSL